jgi:hypothetical protein
MRPVAKQLGDATAVVRTDEYATRPLEDMAKSLTCEPHGRGVEERLDLVDIVAYDAEES